MFNPLLGGLTPQQFLAEYWQKKPLLIRGAVTDFPELIDFARLSELAQRDDVESRLIECKNGDWKLEKGPFRPARFKKLGACDWTLLVQTVNHHIGHIDELMHRFDFLPHYRLDDLMISFAPPGGTVGPHYDSYDVFLLQVGGKKHWQIGSDAQTELVEGAPLKILKQFTPEQEWMLEHGDMLYLPPKYAHYGVAQEPGMTYSIGFRAPTAQELGVKFLEFLQDRICLDGMYADPDLAWQAEPAAISDQYVGKIKDLLGQLRWDDTLLRQFIGQYFSEPKAHVFYEQPDEPLSEKKFAKQLAQEGVALDLKTQMLYEQGRFYVNGEEMEVEPDWLPVLQQLANQRRLPAGDYTAGVRAALYLCYDYGYLHLGQQIGEVV